jgi:hypothetical protein
MCGFPYFASLNLELDVHYDHLFYKLCKFLVRIQERVRVVVLGREVQEFDEFEKV